MCFISVAFYSVEGRDRVGTMIFQIIVNTCTGNIDNPRKQTQKTAKRIYAIYLHSHLKKVSREVLHMFSAQLGKNDQRLNLFKP